MLEVSLIIPTYNEAQNIPLVVKEIFSLVTKDLIDLEIIIVDDNSPDGTADIAEQLSPEFPVKVVRRSGKMGLGTAVRAGFAASSRPYLGVMDGDLSHDPGIIHDLILSLKEYDIAIGSRFEKASSVENWNFFRKLLSYSGVGCARLLTRTHDPLSGYFFLRRSVIEGVSLQTKGYKILLEILVKGRCEKVVEIPFRFRMRQFSQSKLSIREHFLFIGQLVKYGWYKSRYGHVKPSKSRTINN